MNTLTDKMMVLTFIKNEAYITLSNQCIVYCDVISQQDDRRRERLLMFILNICSMIFKLQIRPMFGLTI